MAKFNVSLGYDGPAKYEQKRGISLVNATKSTATYQVIAETHLMAAIRALTYVSHIDRSKVMLVYKGGNGKPKRFRVNEQGNVVEVDFPLLEEKGGN